MGTKTEKLDFRPNTYIFYFIFAPYGDSGFFGNDRNERKHILRRNRPRVSNFLSHRIVESLIFMTFDILGKSLKTKWSLDLQIGPWIFSEHQGLLVERPSAKIHFEKWPLPTPKHIFQETGKPPQIVFLLLYFLIFYKHCFFTIQVDIWEACGCPGGGHGPYEQIPSNFGRVWSYRTWGKSIFMFFGNIGNSLHHQIPPNWSSDLFLSQGTISGAIK